MCAGRLNWTVGLIAAALLSVWSVEAAARSEALAASQEIQVL